jgi:hypothetical protein
MSESSLQVGYIFILYLFCLQDAALIGLALVITYYIGWWHRGRREAADREAERRNFAQQVCLLFKFKKFWL